MASGSALAIARAILRDAPVLVLDEPTTGLDDENAVQVLASIRRLMAGKTTIIVSHDLHLIRQATRIVVLDRGRVVEEGSARDADAGGRTVRAAVAGCGSIAIPRGGQDRSSRRSRRIMSAVDRAALVTARGDDRAAARCRPVRSSRQGIASSAFSAAAAISTSTTSGASERGCRCIGKTVRPDRLARAVMPAPDYFAKGGCC